jgi:peptidylprolyl isomerase
MIGTSGRWVPGAGGVGATRMPAVTRRPVIVASLAACLALAAAGCGSKSGKSSTTATAASTPAPATTPAAPTPSGPAVKRVKGDANLKHKPKIAKQTGPAPAQLQVADIVVGKGPAAKPGDQLTVQYVGVDRKTGKQFDASWDHGSPFPFQLGAGNVIPGWDQGLVGMRVGGRRQLTIPPNLAYGAQGSPPAIGPNATLVFVIDLLHT